MVSAMDVDDTLEDEIRDECSKYGLVEQVVICQERHGKDPQDVAVKIFVKFSNGAEADKGHKALHGRYFAGKVIHAELYDENMFLHGNFTS